MGFISGAMDKSLFNKVSYAAAFGTDSKNGYAVVRITPRARLKNDDKSQSTIKGVIDMDSGGLSFNIDATWTEMGGLAQSVLPEGITKFGPIYDKVNTLANLGGAATMGVAYASKLIYQNSSFLQINIPMMVVDWEATGQPLYVAMLLANYMLPSKTGIDGKTIISSIEQSLRDFLTAKEGDSAEVKVAKNLALTSLNLGEGATIAAKKFADNIADTVQINDKSGLIRAARENLEPDADDITTLRASPTPVRVEIGEYFDNPDMVITNIKFDFSKEMTRNGPLFAKFDISLSTRSKLVDLDGVGLIPMNGNRRYTETTSLV